MKIKLVVLGASTHGLGMESWLRQHGHEHSSEDTYVLSIAPYNLNDNTLYYRTHEGILRRQSMHPSWVGAAEQTAMRFARETDCPNIPAPQRRFGASMTETAHRFGYPSMTLGATSQQEETFLRTEKPQETQGSSSSIDMMSGWCVAVVQSLVQGITRKEV